MDPISFGGTLAAAMELYEMGVVTDADTDGVPLTFGNAEALTIMAEKTGRFEGFGRTLGLGSKRLAEKYGHPEVSITIKGQEIPGYDARALQGMGLGYATSPRVRAPGSRLVATLGGHLEQTERAPGIRAGPPHEGTRNRLPVFQEARTTTTTSRRYAAPAGAGCVPYGRLRRSRSSA